MKWLMTACLIWVASSAQAVGYHYCSGKVVDLITRATPENTSVEISGMTGAAKLGYGGTTESSMQERQFSMLLAAYMAGENVTLEFEGSSHCTDNHSQKLIRFVRLKK